MVLLINVPRSARGPPWMKESVREVGTPWATRSTLLIPLWRDQSRKHHLGCCTPMEPVARRAYHPLLGMATAKDDVSLPRHNSPAVVRRRRMRRVRAYSFKSFRPPQRPRLRLLVVATLRRQSHQSRMVHGDAWRHILEEIVGRRLRRDMSVVPAPRPGPWLALWSDGAVRSLRASSTAAW